jgi:hypothetical protein
VKSTEIVREMNRWEMDRNIFVNMRSEKHWQSLQRKIENTFIGEYEGPQEEDKHERVIGNYRDLDIAYDTFIRYFEAEKGLLDQFEQDYKINHDTRVITISDCRIIPILGMLRMFDDYKSASISQDWKLSTYSTFEEVSFSQAYEKIAEFRQGEGNSTKNFELNKSEYDKLYELKNLSQFIFYNGVRYFYFVQGKIDEIVEVETTFEFNFNASHMYDVIYSTNPIDLVFLSARLSSNRRK